MSRNILEKEIRSSILELLREAPEEESTPTPKPKPQPQRAPGHGQRKKKKKSGPAPGSITIAAGGIGSGNFSNPVKEAKARAQSDPKGLLEDLGIKGASGNDLEQVSGIFNQAILTNDIMGEAYSGASIQTDTDKEGKEVKVVAIAPSGINVRNGIKFLTYTLQAAQSIGAFSPTGAIVFSKGQNFPIVVFSL